MRIPETAKALIVAEFEVDDCDSMSDYFNTRRTQTVALAFSTHTRDLFAELRKAAATFQETAAMAPGQDRYTVYVALETDIRSNGMYWRGAVSPWHHALQAIEPFTTRAAAEDFIASAPAPYPIEFEGTLATFAYAIRFESFEHRQKYSMGRGYYLSMGSTYGTGWRVRKTSLSEYKDGTFTADLTGGGAVLKAVEPPTEPSPVEVVNAYARPDDAELYGEAAARIQADRAAEDVPDPVPAPRKGTLLQFPVKTGTQPAGDAS